MAQPLTRRRMLELLSAEGQLARRPLPEQSEPDFWEQAIGVASNAAPIVGGVAGTALGAGLGLLGGPAAPVTVSGGAALGGAIGGGLGQLAGVGLGMGADHMRGERERRDLDIEEDEMRRLARRQTLLSLL